MIPQMDSTWICFAFNHVPEKRAAGDLKAGVAGGRAGRGIVRR